MAAILILVYVVTRHSMFYVCSVVSCAEILLMSSFRILLALNIVNLILDTVGNTVNAVFITTELQLNCLPCIAIHVI